MNSNMLAHDAVQRNLAALAARGVRFVEPGEGYLACGWIGKGRLAEPDDVVAAVEQALRRRSVAVRPARNRDGRSDLRRSGSRALHRQSIQRSDGLRAGCRSRGARCRCRAHHGTDLAARSRYPTPFASGPPPRCARRCSRTLPGADVLVMAAAVANYTPAHVSREKIAHKDDDLVADARADTRHPCGCGGVAP